MEEPKSIKDKTDFIKDGIKHKEHRLDKSVVTLTLKQLLFIVVFFLLVSNVITFILVRSVYREEVLKLQYLIDIKNKGKDEKLGDIKNELEKVQPRKMSGEKIQKLSFAIYDSYEEYPSLLIFKPSEIVRLIHVESGFIDDAVSHKGALGCMQLMPLIVVAYNVNDVFDCEDSVRGGLRYLAHLANIYKTKELALYAYYTGEKNLDYWLKKGIIPEYLIEYKDKVIS